MIAYDDLAPYKIYSGSEWLQVYEQWDGWNGVIICRVCWAQFPVQWVSTEELTMHFDYHGPRPVLLPEGEK